MSRPAKGPRLYLRGRKGSQAYWVILDSGGEFGTGCSAGDRSGAEKALADYLTEKHAPAKATDRLERLFVADIMNIYLKEQGPKTADKGTWLGHMATPVIEWWGSAGKTLADVKKAACDEYVAWRIKQGVSNQTARHELIQLRAGINHFHEAHGPLPAVPVVSLPPEAAPRLDYFLTRKQAAERIRAARRHGHTKHVARLILIGVYTGTRPGAICALSWLPATVGGWFDLEREILYRRAPRNRSAGKKRYPPVRIHRRLLPHLRRWKRLDLENKQKDGSKGEPITHVIHYYGKPVKRVHRAWNGVAEAAGHAKLKGLYRNKTRQIEVVDGPHICRHTCATWLMQSKVDLNEAAGYLGMTPETLWETYGHHHPDFQDEAAKASGRR